MARFRAACLCAALLAAVVAAMAPETAAAEDFYLRAGFTVEGSKTGRFMDKDCSSQSPAALYGCGAGVDGAPRSSRGDFGTGGGVDLGLGYAATSALRLEALAQYHPGFSFKGRANFNQTTGRQDVAADLSTLTGMLAAYVDLPALGLPRIGPFSPFIGAGAGLSRVRIGETRMHFPRTTTVVPGGRRTGFAWMVTSGFSASLGDLWENVTLDLAWHYTDYGAAETGRGQGRVEWRDGSRAPLALDLAPTRADLRRHGFAASLRYAF